MNDTEYEQTLLNIADRNATRGADAVYDAAEADVSAGVRVFDFAAVESPKRIGRLLLVAAIVVLLVAAGIGALGRFRATEQDVVTTPPPRGALTPMVELLSRLPASVQAAGGTVAFTDVRGARQSWDIVAPQGREPASKAAEDLAHLVQDRAGINLPVVSFCTECASGTVADAHAADVKRNGYALSDVDAMIQTDRSLLVIGRFDPAAAEAALTPAGHDVARGTYRDSTMLTISCRPSAGATAPPPDAIAQACIRFGSESIIEVINNGMIAEASSVDDARAVVDRQVGVGPSAADDPQSRAMAAGADSAHVYTLRFLPPSKVRCGDTAPCAFDPYYVTGTVGAFGLARQNGHAANSAVYVLANSSASAAEQNATVVGNWYRNGHSAISGQAISARYDAPSTSLVGGVAVVVIPMKPGVPAQDLWSDFARRDYPAW